MPRHETVSTTPTRWPTAQDIDLYRPARRRSACCAATRRSATNGVDRSARSAHVKGCAAMAGFTRPGKSRRQRYQAVAGRGGAGRSGPRSAQVSGKGTGAQGPLRVHRKLSLHQRFLSRCSSDPSTRHSTLNATLVMVQQKRRGQFSRTSSPTPLTPPVWATARRAGLGYWAEDRTRRAPPPSFTDPSHRPACTNTPVQPCT